MSLAHCRNWAILAVVLSAEAFPLSSSVLGHAKSATALAATPEKTDGPKADQRWPFRRFVKTAFFYNAPGAKAKGEKSGYARGDVVWDANSGLEWGVLDDVVMGGVSQSRFVTDAAAGVGVWEGEVSTDNNGGFCGTRTRNISPALDLSKARGVRIRCKGDGKRYKFILRDDTDWNGTSWAFSFDTKAGKTITVDIPFGALIPTKFAKVLEDHPPFDNSGVTVLQLTYSKFEYSGDLNPKFSAGPFRFELETITAF